MAQDEPQRTAGARRFGWRSTRSRIFLLVAVCLVPAVLGSIVALSALASVHSSVVRLDERSVRPLAALGDLRDMEGDMRTGVRDYLVAASADRAGIARDLRTTDAQADGDIAAYFVANGGHADHTGRLMDQFVPLLATWRKVRDTQVLAPAAAGNLDQAYRGLRGPLAAADDAMAAPLDAVFTAEVSDSDTNRHRADSAFNRSRVIVGVIVGVGVLIALLVAWLLTAGLLRVVAAIGSVLSGGDPQARVGLDDGGDIGALATALDTMLDGAAALDVELRAGQQARENQLRRAHVQQRLAEQQVRRRAQAVIDETAESVSGELAQVAEQAQAVRTAAATIEARVDAAGELTRHVVEHARTSDGVVTAVTESLRRVGGIAQLIAGVAEQTNLLALNATIEAARAGEAGKGFAVVAAEVKELAATTGRSTAEISVTLATLENDAAAMAATIHAMTDGIVGLGQATGQLTDVASEQQDTARHLDQCVGGAIERIRAMALLTERLDRRSSTRALTSGEISMTVGGNRHLLTLLDISEGGLRGQLSAQAGVGLGSLGTVELTVADLSERIDVRVVRREAGPDGDDVGLEFVGLAAAARTQIARYVDSLLHSDGLVGS